MIKKFLSLTFLAAVIFADSAHADFFRAKANIPTSTQQESQVQQSNLVKSNKEAEKDTSNKVVKPEPKVTKPSVVKKEKPAQAQTMQANKTAEQKKITKVIRIRLVANSIKWSTSAQVSQLADWFYIHSDKRLAIQFDTVHTSFTNIPFTAVRGAGGLMGVDPDWYDQNVTPFGKGYDMVLFFLNDEDWQAPGVAGWRSDRDQGPVELEVRANENDVSYSQGYALRAFVDYSRHEITHGIFMITGQEDQTHQYWSSRKFDDVLSQIDYSKI